MTENGSIEPENTDKRDPEQDGARTTRGIRFSDSEWEEVKKAAEERGLPAGKLVRDTVLDLARNTTGAASASLPPGHAALLERVYRGVYILSTLKREEMLRQGRGQELDEVVQAARNAQAEALKQSHPEQRE